MDSNLRSLSLVLCVAGACAQVWAADVRVAVEAPSPEDAAALFDKLSQTGAKHGLRYIDAPEDYQFRVAGQWQHSSAAKVAVLGIAPESVAAVLTPGCELLFIIDRAGNIYNGFNPVTPLANRIGKRLAAHLKQAGGTPGPPGTAAATSGLAQTPTAGKGIPVRVDGTPDDARGLIERLNEHGRKDGVAYVQTGESYRFRIAAATERRALGGVGGGAAVLTPECKLLFAVGRMGRSTRGGAINAVAKELHRNLSAHLAAP